MRQPILIILLIAVSAFLAAQTDPPGRVGRLSYSDGPVSFQPAGVTDWVDADVNRPLTTGDQVWVGDARASGNSRGIDCVAFGLEHGIPVPEPG